ncbi:SDR family NAD(P)-dependent oxidoreductase [Streptomyces chryseus]
MHGAAAVLGGVDAVVTAFGSVAFGRADEIGDEVAEHLMAVNVLAPAAFFRAAPALVRPGSLIAAFTGVVADRPQAGMADYNASKAALSAWLTAARREARAVGIRVLDVRPGHLDTGFADRPVAGTAPPLPTGGDPAPGRRSGRRAAAHVPGRDTRRRTARQVSRRCDVEATTGRR